MGIQLNKMAGIAVGFAAVALIGLLPTGATAESHPQEVLDLIAAHHALAMKIRPLHDRIVVAAPPTGNNTDFKPEGVPLRAKNAATTGQNSTEAESRVSETLRHRDRAATTSDNCGRIKVRLSALEGDARAELERVSRPGFGIRSVQRDSEAGDIRFGDGRRGSRPPSSTKQQDKSGAGAAGNVDANEIADAQKALAAFQRESATLEREVNALDCR